MGLVLKDAPQKVWYMQTARIKAIASTLKKLSRKFNFFSTVFLIRAATNPRPKGGDSSLRSLYYTGCTEKNYNTLFLLITFERMARF